MWKRFLPNIPPPARGRGWRTSRPFSNPGVGFVEVVSPAPAPRRSTNCVHGTRRTKQHRHRKASGHPAASGAGCLRSRSKCACRGRFGHQNESGSRLPRRACTRVPTPHARQPCGRRRGGAATRRSFCPSPGRRRAASAAPVSSCRSRSARRAQAGCPNTTLRRSADGFARWEERNSSSSG